MFEVEAKFRLDRPEALRERLAAAGAVAGATTLQEDLFFTHPALALADRDEALRLRREGASAELTWKGPRLRGGGEGKVRREENVPVGADPTGLLRGLGFEPTLKVRKRRTPYRFDDVTVTLDDVETLGWFAEVEAMSEDVQAAHAAVEATAGRLGLSGAVDLSYAELLARL